MEVGRATTRWPDCRHVVAIVSSGDEGGSVEEPSGPRAQETAPATTAKTTKESVALRACMVLLLCVDRQPRGFLPKEVRPREARRNVLELTRRLTEVEHIRHARGTAVGRSQPAKAEGIFDESYDAAEFVDGV